MKRIVVMCSGGGSNFQTIIDGCQKGEINGQIVQMISTARKGYCLERASRAGIPSVVIHKSDYETMEALNEARHQALCAAKPDLIVLAGFLGILPPQTIQAFSGKIINIHPAYLPNFPGAHGIRDAYEAKVSFTGVTVHYVDEGIDTGEIILQEKLSIDPAWTLEELETHVHALEYELFPRAVRQICKEIEEGKQ